MPVTFRKRIKILPFLYMNIGKRGVSWSLKAGPVSRTFGSDRTTTSVDLPGPLGYRTSRRRRRSNPED